MMEHNDETRSGDTGSLEELDTLSRYVRGDLSREEQDQVELAMQSSSSVRSIVRVLARSRVRPSDGASAANLEARLQQLQDAMGQRPVAGRDDANSRVRSSGLVVRGAQVGARRWTWIAATAGVIVAVAAGTFFTTRPATVSTPQPQQYVTALGERVSFTLPDGSQVILGPASRLSVAPGFGEGRRDVSVEGNAYFSIASTSTSPFTVSAGDARIRVLGTEFGVRHYDNDSVVTVAVESGRVAVGSVQRPGSMSLVAGANEIATVSASQASVHPSNTGVERLTAWTRGELRFDQTPLREALPELERWYDVDFQLTDASIGKISLTGGFPSQRIEDLEATLRYVLPLTVRRSGRTITLSPR